MFCPFAVTAWQSALIVAAVNVLCNGGNLTLCSVRASKCKALNTATELALTPCKETAQPNGAGVLLLLPMLGVSPLPEHAR